MTYEYATSPGNVVTDAAGNVVEGWRIDIYDARTGGTLITDIEKLDGTALPGYVTTDADGRYSFRRVDETLEVLWADDGQSGKRWSLVANEAMTAASDAAASAAAAQADADAAAQSASDAAASAAEAESADATANQALSEVTAYQQQTPTLEELVYSTSLAASDHPVMAVPVTLKFNSLYLVFPTASVTASDTDYYIVEFIRKSQSDGTETVVGTRNTKLTGTNAGGGISPLTSWSFAGVDLTLVAFTSGDVAFIRVSSVGAPTGLTYPVVASGNYLPV